MTHATLVLARQRIERPVSRAVRLFPLGWIVALLVALLIGVAAAYVAVTNRVISANYSIRRDEARIREFREDLKVFEAEVAQAKSIPALQAAAARRGLVPADRVSYVQASRDAMAQR